MSSLNGIRILDLSRLLPGPYCTLLLGDLGAEVIKVEERGRGDYIRHMMPGVYYAVNRNKKSITVNLSKEEGKEIVYRLAERSDVAVEGFRPGVAERLGVGYRELQKVNPQIIYCSISGFGQDGPYRTWPGHDINYLSLSGAMSIPGSFNNPPARPGLPIVDLCSGMFAALSILAAVIARSRTGKGQYLDVSMADAIFSWVSTRAGEFMLSGRETTPMEYTHLSATNDTYETADGKKISLGILEEHFWQNLCKGIGREDLLNDDRFTNHVLRRKNASDLIEILKKVFKEKTRDEWVRILATAGVPVTPVNSVKEAFEDPQLNARGMILDLFLEQLGRSIKQVNFPVKMSGTPPEIKSPPPEMGQHTSEILTWLGYNEEEIKNLYAKEVI